VIDIISKAVLIEEEGEKIYRDLAAKSRNTGLKKIFTYLADAELEHKRVFELMDRGGNTFSAEDDILKRVKAVFAALGKKTDSATMEHYEVGVYRKALSVEQKSIDYYENIKGKIEDFPIIYLSQKSRAY